MLITSHFVLLNVPKSGSSFVRHVIKDIYAARAISKRGANRERRNLRRLIMGRGPAGRPEDDDFLKELILPNIRLPGRQPDQHGTYSQIPNRYKHRPIVSVVRDPYSKLVSDFTFGWWEKYPPVSAVKIRQKIKEFPAIDFPRFLEMSRMTAAAKLGGKNPRELGNLTIEFVQFFFKDPDKSLNSLSDDYIESGEFCRDMPEIIFMDQKNLNEDLAAVLAKFSFTPDEQERCRNSAKVNASPTRAGETPVMWDAGSLDMVNAEERYLFRMLDKLGFSFEVPKPHRT